MKLTTKYQVGELNYLAPEKEESFLRALLNSVIFFILIGGFMWIVLKLIEIGVLPK